MGNMARRVLNSSPLVVVIGPTGAGKSKLSIEIAKKFNGEIISADSMQVYKGLDLVTNKVTEEEKQGIPHFLLDFLDPLSNFSVVDFRDSSLPLINKIHQKGKLPIIVGGTNYYIEAILWDFLVSPMSPSKQGLKNEPTTLDLEAETIKSKMSVACNPPKFDGNLEDILANPIIPNLLLNVSNSELHQLLMKVDSERGSSLHPNDRRKVIRSLQVFQQTGKLHSEHLRQQRSQRGGSSVSGPLRYLNSLIFYVRCEKIALDKRIDLRVDDMMEKGLVDEMSKFHKEYNQQRILDKSDADYTKGIFQSIGFKEFHDYLLLNDCDRDSDKGKLIFNDGVESMKRVTKQYAKKQNQWIENRFLKKSSRSVPPVYALDTTNIEKWDESVRDVSYEIIEAYLNGANSIHEPLPCEDGIENRLQSFYCEKCDKIIVGSHIWEIHLKSRNHQKRKTKKMKTDDNTVSV